jgi:hypothetical protein
VEQLGIVLGSLMGVFGVYTSGSLLIIVGKTVELKLQLVLTEIFCSLTMM